MLGFGDKAAEYFRMINPIEHARTKDAANKYKVEPYVIPADIYGQLNLAGRGGWTWYTGSSSWMYVAGLKYILGLNIEFGYLSFKPCIPNNWKEFSIRYKYKSSIYNIMFKNFNEKVNEISKVIVNNAEILDGKIKLEDNGGIFNVDVLM